MFKYFPGTYTSDHRKVPIAELKGWYEQGLATSDQGQINEWARLYSHKIKFWCLPTGPTNGLLVLDVDVKDQNANGFNTLHERGFSFPQTMSQRTPSGGQHFFFRYPDDGRTYGNRVGFAPGLDIRGVGGYVAEYGRDNTPIADAPDWLLAEALKGERVAVDLDSLAYVSPHLVDIMLGQACENIREAPQGEANNVMNVEAYKIGQLIPSGSLDPNRAYSELFYAAIARGKSEREARATLTSGLDGGRKNPLTDPFAHLPPVVDLVIEETAPSKRWTPNFFTRQDLTNMSKLRKPQLFKDWSTEDISITTADGGTGKTTLKLNEAICLALGEDFLGFKCNGAGRTLYITGEDSAEKLAAMLGQILTQMGLMDGSPENEAKVRKVLNNILIKKESDLMLITKSKDGFIRYSQEAMDKVMEAIEDLRPRMIVFDPISSFWGSESSLNDMAKAVTTFMGILVEKSSACVEVINHMGKASSKDKDMSQFAGRGGTGLPSHARVSRVLRPLFDEEFLELTGTDLGERSAILCNVNKFSDGSPLYNKPFVILREGYLFNRVPLTETKVKDQVEQMSDVERIMDVVRQERMLGRYPTERMVFAWASMQQMKLSKDRVKNALTTLTYSGLMGEKVKYIDNPDLTSPDRKCLVITDSEGKEL